MYLALPDSTGRFPQGYLGLEVLKNKNDWSLCFRLRGFHSLWLSFPEHLTNKVICNQLPNKLP